VREPDELLTRIVDCPAEGLSSALIFSYRLSLAGPSVLTKTLCQQAVTRGGDQIPDAVTAQTQLSLMYRLKEFLNKM